MSFLKDNAINLALRYKARPSITNRTWRIEPDELADIEIRYPTKYQWAAAHGWYELLLSEWRRRVRVVMTDLPQPHRGTVAIQFVKGGRAHDVILDYSDYPNIAEAASDYSLYFKMQYRRDGYAMENVVPGGYVTDSPRLYWNLRRLQRQRDKRQFKHEVLGRFGLDNARDARLRAVEILNEQQRFKYEGGWKTVKYNEFLREIAAAKICIDLPGEGDFCFRLVNYMAIGACVVAFPHRTRLHVPLEDGKHIAYTREDFSDLIELCEFYLHNDEKREAMCTASRKYFEENLHNANLANYYLRTLLDNC